MRVLLTLCLSMCVLATNVGKLDTYSNAQCSGSATGSQFVYPEACVVAGTNSYKYTCAGATLKMNVYAASTTCTGTPSVVDYTSCRSNRKGVCEAAPAELSANGIVSGSAWEYSTSRCTGRYSLISRPSVCVNKEKTLCTGKSLVQFKYADSNCQTKSEATVTKDILGQTCKAVPGTSNKFWRSTGVTCSPAAVAKPFALVTAAALVASVLFR